MDEKAYPASELAEVYFQRWDVELYFRDIKTTMDMDILRCKTPDMVRKEILMHMIVYNCIRALIVEAVKEKTTKTRRISFKASMQALRQWQPYLNQVNISQQELRRLIQLLYTSIAESIVLERPGRSGIRGQYTF